MSESEAPSSRIKTKQQYSRNVKKLKYKLQNVRFEIESMEKKVENLTKTSNDKMIALKIAKFCKQRRFTPEMLFRFADRKGQKVISKVEFQDTLTRLGLKLNKEEVMRMEYLIDQDLSGSLDWRQYNNYLDAFGIKKQFTPGENTARQALANLDIDKLLQGVDDDTDIRKDKRKKSNLLTYQDFVKYCHKHYPELKDRDIASIFERLQRNQLIDLQHFLDYLMEKREQKKKQEEKNKKSKIKRGSSLATDTKALKEAGTLKGLIQALFRSRGKDTTPLFHSSQFLRLQRILNRRRGQLTVIFKEIDRKRKQVSLNTPYRGSFGYNQLINYFIDKEEKGSDLAYAFELMGHKFAAHKHTPDSVISQYTQEPGKLTQAEWKKFMEDEFEITGREYDIISKLAPREDGFIPVPLLIDMMKAEDKRGLIFIRPNVAASRLIFRNGLAALRCCLEIVSKMAKARIAKWHDCDFGPSESDEYGLDSIDITLPSEQVNWERADTLGMMQFFNAGITNADSALTSPICPHDMVAQSLWGLSKAQDNWLYPQSKPDYQSKEVKDAQLSHIFDGIYPYVFHPFAKYGIYVIKLWVDQRWKFIIIDDKLPCGLDNRLYFSSSPNLKLSFVSIIEKAMAKLHGTYKLLYAVHSTQRYMIQLTGAMCMEQPLAESMPEGELNSLWADFVHAFTKQDQLAIEAKKSKMRDVMMGIFKGVRQGLDTNFHGRLPYKVYAALEIMYQAEQSKQKSHRVLLLQPGVQLTNQKDWNKQWSKQGGDNYYQKFKAQLGDSMDKDIVGNPLNLFISYQLFRKVFNLLRMRKVDWALNIVLRKDLQFEEKHKCRYEITAKSTELELLIYLRQKSLISEQKVNLDVIHVDSQGQEKVISKVGFKNILTLLSIKFEKDKKVILEFYIENWSADKQYQYALTFYLSHPRFQLKQRDRHMLFRYVSPFEQISKIQWGQFTKQQRQYIYRQFYKQAEPRGCCGCL